jgi:integrase
MGRTLNKLTALRVAKFRDAGRYGDGGGLWLQISPAGTRSWLFRFMRDGRARMMGLGSLDTIGLADARERAREARKALLDGIDPIEARKTSRQALAARESKRITFREAAEQAVAVFQDEWLNPKHGQQWPATLETYVYPVIGKLSVADIDAGHIEKLLRPIWTQKHETARRVRQRVERILGWAAAAGYRSSENPAALANVGPLLASGKKIKKVRHQPAMPYDELPPFMAELRASSFISARALEFTILTATRTSEVTGARWPEIDFAAKVWTIPPERMKANREHRVPLSRAALALLAALPREGDGYVFPGAKAHRPLSNMAMLEMLRGMRSEGYVVHGFRSSFRDWAGEQTNFPRDVAEAALAHALRDKTEAAYRRGDALEKRRRLMEAWAEYCAKPVAGDVLPMRRAM